jgi:tetratricopeptide (TPR) repeat protein
LVDQGHEAEISPAVELALPAESGGGMKAALQRARWHQRNPANRVAFLLRALSCYGVLERDDWIAQLEGSSLEREKVAQVRRMVYEELLWLADDVANREVHHGSGRKVGPKEAAQEGLTYLCKAELTVPLTRAFYQIRGWCRKRLGAEVEARQDTGLAQRMPATMALDHYLLALAAYGRGDRAGGVKEFEAALWLEATHYWSLMGLGACLIELGQGEQDFVAAATAFTGCILKRPEHAHAYCYRGGAYLKLGRTKEALADYAKAIVLHPKHAPAWGMRGVSYVMLGQLDKALPDLGKVIDLDPKNMLAWSNRGIAYQRMGQRDKALADLTRAIELDPKLAPIWTNRGVIYGESGHRDKALVDLSIAIELDPKYWPAWANRGAVQEKLGQLAKPWLTTPKPLSWNPNTRRSGPSGAWFTRVWTSSTRPWPTFPKPLT